MEKITSSDAHLGRAHGAELNQKSINVEFEGRTVGARLGESLLAALVASGEYHLRTTRSGAARGPFCGMGVCQECLVNIDGMSCQRACMVKIEKSIKVKRQVDPVKISVGDSHSASSEIFSSLPKEPDIVVVGGGAGGMNAAIWAARLGAEVLLIDERSQLGGQFYKQPISAPGLDTERWDDKQFRDGKSLIHKTIASRAKILNNASVIAAYEPCELLVAYKQRTMLIRSKKLVIATGAYELGMHVPGWTLPGVMTTGAAQTLLRSYRVLAGKSVLVVGNGPLNLQVGLELAKAGADVKAVAEAALPPSAQAARACVGMLASDPGLAARGAGYIANLIRRRIPVLYSRSLASVEILRDATRPRLKAALRNWRLGRSCEESFEIDAVCVGYGFAPSNEILRSLGCRQVVNNEMGFLETAIGENCETTCPGLYAVGDCKRLGGSRIAEAEGIIAGIAAANSLGFRTTEPAKKAICSARAVRRRQQKFQKALWKMFKPPEGLFSFVDKSVLVCRCEEVTGREISDGLLNSGANPAASLKRTTRAGMGRCQGRYCAPAINRICTASKLDLMEENDFWAPRPPVKPTSIAELARMQTAYDN